LLTLVYIERSLCVTAGMQRTVLKMKIIRTTRME